MGNRYDASRRKFLHLLGLAGLSIPFISADSFCGTNTSNKPAGKRGKEGKLGIALVGLGGYSAGQLAPALQQTEHCYLAGIVTGTPSKIPEWQPKYGIPDENVYSYENFDTIADNKDIDIIYIVLPNGLHAEYAIRAAKAGKHVICEKPMAITVEDCTSMIEACKKADKMLSIGYRLHFEPYNLEMVRLGTQKVYGALQEIEAGFGFAIGQPGPWRLNKALAGGGPLQDVGIYAINGICYTSGQVPLAVRAVEGEKTDLVKFKEVEQSISWEFDMPGRWIAKGKTSYAEYYNFLTARAEKGQFGLDPAYGYSGQKGFSPSGVMRLPQINQQAAQMDDFALAIMKKRPTPVPGEMGRRDVQLIQAIYESAATGKQVDLKLI
jgi:predicted dehydrogenase